MPREIFGEVANPTRRLGSQSRYTVPVSIAVHVAIAIGVVIVPLMATDVLPAPRSVIGAFTAAQPVPPPPPPPAAATSSSSSSKPRTVVSNAAPTDPPSTIETEPPTTASVVGEPGVEGGIGIPGGSFGNVVVPGVPPTPPPPAPAAPVRVGPRIREPTKIRHVPPVYPVMAQQARVEGVVVIEAVIGVDGRVKEARVLRSKPLLDEAALEAVRQWTFTPTTLNGVPVPVIMTVTVNFKLN